MSKSQRVYCRACNGWMIEFDKARFEVVRCRSGVTYGGFRERSDQPRRLNPVSGATILRDPGDWEDIEDRERENRYLWPEAGHRPSPVVEYRVRCRCGKRWVWRR